VDTTEAANSASSASSRAVGVRNHRDGARREDAQPPYSRERSARQQPATRSPLGYLFHMILPGKAGPASSEVRARRPSARASTSTDGDELVCYECVELLDVRNRTFFVNQTVTHRNDLWGYTAKGGLATTALAGRGVQDRGALNEASPPSLRSARAARRQLWKQIN